MFEISDDRFRPEVAEIGQKNFFTQKNIQSVSDNNMDPWKRFLTKKSVFDAFCKKASKTCRPLNTLFKSPVGLKFSIYCKKSLFLL